MGPGPRRLATPRGLRKAAPRRLHRLVPPRPRLRAPDARKRTPFPCCLGALARFQRDVTLGARDGVREQGRGFVCLVTAQRGDAGRIRDEIRGRQTLPRYITYYDITCCTTIYCTILYYYIITYAIL